MTRYVARIKLFVSDILRKKRLIKFRLLFVICIFLLLILHDTRMPSRHDTEHKPLIDALFRKNSSLNIESDEQQLTYGTLKELKLLSDYKSLVQLIGNTGIPLTVSSDYLMENSRLCSSAKHLLVVVIVHTSTDNFEQRRVIRQTWGNITIGEALGGFRIVFMAGISALSTVHKQLEQEHREFGDILQGNFIDTYHNLTLKGVMGFKWLTERCTNAKFVIKTDDDVIVDTRNLLTAIRHDLSGLSKTMTGDLKSDQEIWRRPGTKWYVRPSIFPGREMYPSFFRGYFVGFSTDLIPRLYEAAKSTPFFWVDDVYLYGLLPSRIPDVKYISTWPYVLTTTDSVLRACLRTKRCHFLAAGEFTPKVLHQLWLCIEQRHSSSQSSQLTHCDCKHYKITFDKDFIMDFLFPTIL